MTKNYRLGKNTTERYSSLEELRAGFGLKPVSKRTSDENKLKSQREKFLRTCKSCGEPMEVISGVNVMCCTNPKCKGIKIKSKDAEGKDIYVPVSRTLDEKGFEISLNLFD